MAQANTDDGNSFDGRIWVTREQREWVNDHKQGSDNQADVVDRLIEFYENHDPDAVDTAEPDVDALAGAVAERVGADISEAIWDTLDADELAQQTAAYVDGADTASIAKETADEVERRLR